MQWKKRRKSNERYEYIKTVVLIERKRKRGSYVANIKARCGNTREKRVEKKRREEEERIRREKKKREEEERRRAEKKRRE